MHQKNATEKQMKATSITERDPRNQPSEEIDSFLG